MIRLFCALGLFWLPLPGHAAEFQKLEGHGGPVKAIVVRGNRAMTASFDYSIGLWDLETGTSQWLEGHRAAVNTVLFPDETTAFSGGDDFAVWQWDLTTGEGRQIGQHKGKVMGLSTHGNLLATASWDGSIGIWDLSGVAEPIFLNGHTSNVNAVAFTRDGSQLYSAATDGTLRLWDVSNGSNEVLVRHGFGINAFTLNPDAGWIAYGAVDGGTRAIDLDTGAQLADMTLDRRPILALAQNTDGDQIAVGDAEGYIMVVNTTDWSIHRDFRAALRGPIWALDYAAPGDRIFAAGIEDAVFAWPLVGDLPDQRIGTADRTFLTDPAKMTNGERQFARKCSICHTLTPDGAGARRAGPSLHGLFGRKAGTLPGYSYSQAMRDIDLTWSDETIDKLFDLGPDHYTPGSKMPMQRIQRPEDRRDLIAYLKENTKESAE